MATRLTTIQIVSQIRAELEQMLADESGLSDGLAESSDTAIRLDVVQAREHLCVLVEVPGVAATELEVSVTGNLLTVAGRRTPPDGSRAGSRFLCVERQWGRFQRQVELPAAIDPQRGRATLAHGLLKVEFAVLSDQRNRTYRLEVESAGEGES